MTTLARRVASAWLVMTLSMAMSTAALAAPHRPVSRPATVQVMTVNTQGRWTVRHELPLSQTRDIHIQVSWNVPGRHLQRLHLIAPDGALYQRFTATFDGDDPRRSYTNPREVLVDTLVPIAGTWITEYAMGGQWTIEVYVDDGPTPVATSGFRLLND
jgi:hypothetical protein